MKIFLSGVSQKGTFINFKTLTGGMDKKTRQKLVVEWQGSINYSPNPSIPLVSDCSTRLKWFNTWETIYLKCSVSPVSHHLINSKFLYFAMKSAMGCVSRLPHGALGIHGEKNFVGERFSTSLRDGRSWRWLFVICTFIFSVPSHTPPPPHPALIFRIWSRVLLWILVSPYDSIKFNRVRGERIKQIYFILSRS